MDVTAQSAITSAENALSCATAAAVRSRRVDRPGSTVEAAATAGAGSAAELADGGPPAMELCPSDI